MIAVFILSSSVLGVAGFVHGLPNGTRPKTLGLVAFAWALIATGEHTATRFSRLVACDTSTH